MKKLLIYAVMIAASVQVSLAQDAECATKLSLSNEYVKTSNFTEAEPIWRELRKSCPGFHQAIYTNGEKILNHLAENASDAATKEKHVRDLMVLIEEYQKHFPDKVSGVDSRKAMYLFENGVGTKDEVYNLLEKAVKTDLENTTNGKALYTYFEMFVDKFEGGNSSYQLQDVFNLYDVISDKIDIETNKLSEELDELLKIEETQELNSRQERSKNRCVVNIESYEIIRTSMDSKIEKLATCDRLVPFLEKSYEENKTNEEWLNRAATRLYKKGCSDSPLFEKISDQLYNINPTPQAAYNKGVNQLKKGNKTKALEFFNQAADLYKDVNKKADVYFTIATQVYGNGNKAQAKAYCDKTLQVKPSYDKAYLYIAQLYANSVNEAADDAFSKRAVYWLAAQTARKAGTSAGNAAAATYDKLAPSRQDIFSAGKSGQQICFKGWIGKCVTVPTL